MFKGRAAGGARQAFHIAALHSERARLLIDASRGFAARHLLVIDVELAVPYLDMVARQADDPLDVVSRRIGRQLEHHDVAALGQMRERQENAAGEQWHPEGQRVAAIAVGVFRDE